MQLYPSLRLWNLKEEGILESTTSHSGGEGLVVSIKVNENEL